jgi:fatty-acyl-CoA synthase
MCSELHTRDTHAARRSQSLRAGLQRNQANYVPLSPLSLLRCTAQVYPDKLSISDGAQRDKWSDTYARCCRLASGLQQLGVGLGDTVAIMAPNVTAMMETHFGVPMLGAVLNTLNVRLDAETLAFMLKHGEAKVLITDREFSGVISKALALMEHRPIIIDLWTLPFSAPQNGAVFLWMLTQ